MMKKRIAGVRLIGRSVLVIDAESDALVGIEGQVVDETRNTLKVMARGGVKTLAKDKVIIKVDGKVVDGKDIIGRIEERIKNSW